MLRVLLMGEPGSHFDALAELLRSAGHEVERMPASRLLHLEALVQAMRPDVVLVDYSDPLRDSVEQLCYASFGFDAPLLVLGQGLDIALSQRLTQAGLAVYAGFKADAAHLGALMPVLDVLVARERSLRIEVDGLKQALTDRRDIERVKEWLAQQRGCTMQTAFEAMRDVAMSRGMSLGAVARDLLSRGIS